VLSGLTVLFGTHKYDLGLSQILHADLPWLDVADWVRYKLGVTVHRCLHNKAPQHLVDCCVPVPDITSRQQLCSARRCLLTVSRHRHSTLGRRAFSVTRPAVLNLLPDHFGDSDCTECTFCQSLKTVFSTSIGVFSALDVYMIMRYINPHFTYLLTCISPDLVECRVCVMWAEVFLVQKKERNLDGGTPIPAGR